LKYYAKRLALKNKKNREAVFHPEFREDLYFRVETERNIALRLLKLVEDVLRDPFTGIGKPEPLKYLHPGAWSRHITQEHGLVYLVQEERIDFLQAKYHY
jgi:toxin YoeB